MTKKVKIIRVLVVVILGIVFGMTTFYNKAQTCNRELLSATDISKISISKEEVGNSKEKIGAKLMQKYFNEFACRSDLEYGLREYKINSVVYHAATDSVENFDITFSVKPIDLQNSQWIRGNGLIQGEWIVKNYGILSVISDGDSYTFNGTGGSGFMLSLSRGY
jgi:hypothetical protein